MAIKNNIVAKKTTELVLLFHKKTTKLLFFGLMWDKKHQSGNFKTGFYLILTQNSLRLTLQFFLKTQ